jgi:hypothetical protein
VGRRRWRAVQYVLARAHEGNHRRGLPRFDANRWARRGSSKSGVRQWGSWGWWRREQTETASLTYEVGLPHSCPRPSGLRYNFRTGES